MNKRIITILVMGVLILSLTYVNTRYYYKENYLYWEESLPEEQKAEEKQAITRRVAIQKAYDIFLKEYGIDLTSSNMQMYVNLYKDEDHNRSYCWLMSWYDYEKKENYTYTIDAIHGEILYLYVGKTGMNQAKSDPESLTYAEITYMVDELAGLLELSLEQMKLEVSYPAKSEGQNYWYQKCKLIDLNTGELMANVILDCTNRMIREYEWKRE